jgi:hypothetical protein
MTFRVLFLPRRCGEGATVSISFIYIFLKSCFLSNSFGEEVVFSLFSMQFISAKRLFFPQKLFPKQICFCKRAVRRANERATPAVHAKGEL